MPHGRCQAVLRALGPLAWASFILYRNISKTIKLILLLKLIVQLLLIIFLLLLLCSKINITTTNVLAIRALRGPLAAAFYCDATGLGTAKLCQAAAMLQPGPGRLRSHDNIIYSGNNIV